MEKLYTVSKNKTRADYGSYHGFLTAKFRLNLKKVEKTTRSFRYNQNQIIMTIHYKVSTFIMPQLQSIK